MSGIDGDYLDLGRMIAGLCPPGFAEARLAARLGPDLAGGADEIALSCRPGDGGETVAVHLYDQARAGFASRLRHIRAAQDRTWHACTVILTKGGGFAMEMDD
jgi:hypothetical protein